MMEVELGYAKCLRLKSEAVPTLELPPARSQKPPTLRPRQHDQSVPKAPSETGCQIEPVNREPACVEANMKPSMQSKGQAPNQSLSYDTGTQMEVPFPESSREPSVPLKRRRCEDPSCPLNDIASSVKCSSTPIEVPPHKDKKYIVHEDQLLELFRRCPVCISRCTVGTRTIGTLLQVTQQCPSCAYSNQWSSQPLVNCIPSGNLQLCAAALFTGSSFLQISKFLQAFNVQGLTEQCFQRHQDKLLIPTVNWQWKLEQDEVIRESIESGAATLGGDMWAHSPGNSAKYDNYTMMDLKSNKVIDIQLIERNTTGNSVCMEKEGFVRSLSMLEEKGVKTQAIVTNCHRGVQKFLREEKKDICHYFDPWQMGKGMGKKMGKLGKRKGTQDMRPWRQRIVNHLYWSALTSSSGEEAVAKWRSVTNPIKNDHTYPGCADKPLVGEQARPCVKPSTATCEKIIAPLLAPRFLNDVQKISPQYHASTLEAFHSLVIKFSPKSETFSFRGMFSRLQIAAMHYNENSTKSHVATREQRYSIVYPEYKRGDHSVRALKTKPTSLYIDKLMALLFESVVENAVPYQEYSEKLSVPEPLGA